MTSIEQAARSFSTKISGHESVRCIDYSIVYQARKRVAGTKRESRTESLAQLDRHRAVKTIAGGDELLEFAARRIRTQVVDCGKCYVERCRRRRTVEVHHRNGNAKLDRAIHCVSVRTAVNKPNQLTRSRRVVKRTRHVCRIDEVSEVTRGKKIREVPVSSGKHGRVCIELAPETYAAREREVCFDGIAATQIALDAGVDLITLRNSQLWVETAREVCIPHSKFAHQRRISIQRLRKAQVGGDERTTLRDSHQLSSRWIAKLVRVEEQLLLAKREV